MVVATDKKGARHKEKMEAAGARRGEQEGDGPIRNEG